MVVGRFRQVVVLCIVNTTKYYLSRLVSGRYGKLVVLWRWFLRQVRLYVAFLLELDISGINKMIHLFVIFAFLHFCIFFFFLLVFLTWAVVVVFVYVARHAQSTQNKFANKRFTYFCSDSRKTWGRKLIFACR